MDKKDAIKTLTDCAVTYDEKFSNRTLMIIYGNDKYNFIETIFPKSAYLHLTGINTTLSPNAFYNKCINNVLAFGDFEFKKDGTTELKLQILSHILNPRKYSMIGNYDNSRQVLRTNKIVGGTYACIGFKHAGKYYVPNTALREDLRDITNNNERIVSILEKPSGDSLYSDVLYEAKNINFVEVLKGIDNTQVNNLIETYSVE